MKAYFFDKRRKPGRLSLRETAKPEPRDGEALVRIRAVSVNAADWRSMRLGLAPKKGVYGADISGVVEAAGPGVPFAAGDEVVADLSSSGFGGFAEYVAAPAAALARKPAGLSHEECAAVPMAAVSALQALRDLGRIQAGQKVLVVGASGGVGSFTVQLAKLSGAVVTGACGAGNAELALGLGAERVIGHSRAELDAEAGYDLVLAVHGDHPPSLYRRMLRPGGTAVVVGGALRQVFAAMLLSPFLSLGARKVRLLAARPSAADLGFILGLLAEGGLKAGIERVYGFSELPQALDYAGGGHARGKLVVRTDIA